MKCKFCNSEVEGNENVCPVCGVEIMKTEQEPVMEYQVNAPSEEINAKPYMVFSILATVLCCMPFGIPAIIFASKIEPLQKGRDYEGARAAAKKAKMFSVIAAILGVVVFIVYVSISSIFYANFEKALSDANYQNRLLQESDVPSDDVEEEENKAPVQPAEASKELGENWDSFTVQINDKVLTFPCTIETFESAGVVLDTDYTPDSYIVNPNEYVMAYFMDANGNEILVDIINNDTSAKTIKECLVGGLSIYDYSVSRGGMTVIFPGGVQIGTTKEDVLSKYGNAQDVYEGDGLHMYTWMADDMSYGKTCEIDLDPGTNLVINMSMRAY